MHDLRWALLCLGVVFIFVLAVIEQRRQRRHGFTDVKPPERESEADPAASVGPMFREPALTLPEMRARDPAPPQQLPVVEIEDDSLNARRVELGEPLMDPPTLSLPIVGSGPVAPRPRVPVEPTMSGIDSVKVASDLNVPRLDTPAPKRVAPRIDLADTYTETGSDHDERAFNDAVFGDASDIPDVLPDAETVPEAAVDIDAPPAEPAKPLFTAADVTPVSDPIVDWPPDDQRRVIALRLVALPPERLAGRALRLALASEGFVLGKFQIFHKPDESGRAVLSAANLSKPGTFDLGTMDVQRYGGLSLFAVLPGPKPPLKAFEDLLTTARNLNDRLQGALQDERGGPLTPTRIASLRETLAAETPS
jgi:cell division protein ZipA